MESITDFGHAQIFESATNYTCILIADRTALVTPGAVERYDIDLWFTSRVFPPGHRLRVTVSSARFPKYDRNLNTGGDNERDTAFVLAHQRLLHDMAHPSHVVLPVVPR